jgi:hypothetical protein
LLVNALSDIVFYHILTTNQESIIMMTLEKIRTQLQDLRPARVAEATGLHFNTIREIRDNPEANPTHRAMKALSVYLEARQ